MPALDRTINWCAGWLLGMGFGSALQAKSAPWYMWVAISLGMLIAVSPWQKIEERK